MTLSESAKYAVTCYIERYNKCRELETKIYGRVSGKTYSKQDIDSGKSFVLSELYNLPLNHNYSTMIFRSENVIESDSLAFQTFDGIFNFTQFMMKSVCESISNRSEIFKSYSKSLVIPLFRYRRGSNLIVNDVILNSIYFDSEVVPLSFFTSYDKLANYELLSPRYAVVDVSDFNLKDLDRYCSDWNLPHINRKASFKKDREVLTNLPIQYRFSNTDTIREYVLAAINNAPLPDCSGFEIIADYIRSNIDYERNCYKSIVRI